MDGNTIILPLSTGPVDRFGVSGFRKSDQGKLEYLLVIVAGLAVLKGAARQKP